MTDNNATELHIGDILFNKPADERIVVVDADSVCVWLRKVQKNDELAMHDGHVWAMLGKKCNAKNMCTQSYAQSVFELDGRVERAIAATLGAGECEVSYEQDGIPRCSNCQNVLYDEYKREDNGIKNYCDECGAKVRKAVGWYVDAYSTM